MEDLEKLPHKKRKKTVSGKSNKSLDAPKISKMIWLKLLKRSINISLCSSKSLMPWFFQFKFALTMEMKPKINSFTSLNIQYFTTWRKTPDKILWWESKEEHKEINRSAWSTWKKKLKTKFISTTPSTTIKFNGRFPSDKSHGQRSSQLLLI